MNATSREHPLVQQGHGWWVYDRHIESDSYPLIPKPTEPTLDKTGTYNTETVYQYVDVSVESGDVVARTSDGSEVPLEQVRKHEPTEYKEVVVG